MIEKQELHCHDCERYVQFEVDMSLNGNHVLECPKCGHEHCRVVQNGIITDDRWDRRNKTHKVGASTWTYVCTSSSTSSGSTFLAASWTNSTCTSS